MEAYAKLLQQSADLLIARAKLRLEKLAPIQAGWRKLRGVSEAAQADQAALINETSRTAQAATWHDCRALGRAGNRRGGGGLGRPRSPGRSGGSPGDARSCGRRPECPRRFSHARGEIGALVAALDAFGKMPCRAVTSKSPKPRRRRPARPDCTGWIR